MLGAGPVAAGLAAWQVSAHWPGVLHFIGVRPVPAGTAPMYQLWSGFLASLAVLGLLGSAAGWYYQHTCHAKPGCLRWGRYEVAGGLGRMCHVHHPDLRGHPRRSHGAVLAALHEDWKRTHLRGRP